MNSSLWRYIRPKDILVSRASSKVAHVQDFGVCSHFVHVHGYTFIEKYHLTVTERDDYTHTERGGSVLTRHFIIGVFDAYRLKLTWVMHF